MAVAHAVQGAVTGVRLARAPPQWPASFLAERFECLDLNSSPPSFLELVVRNSCSRTRER